MIHRIGGIKLLNEFQYEPAKHESLIDDMKVGHSNARIIELSKDLNILSNLTAFIGVEEKKDKITGEMSLKEIPLQKSSHYYIEEGCTGPQNYIDYYGSIGSLSGYEDKPMMFLCSERIENRKSWLNKYRNLPKSLSDLVSKPKTISDQPIPKPIKHRGGQSAYRRSRSFMNKCSSAISDILGKKEETKFEHISTKEINDDSKFEHASISKTTNKLPENLSKYSFNKPILERKIKYEIKVSLKGMYTKLPGIFLTSITNQNFIYMLEIILGQYDINECELNINDFIKLTCEEDYVLNTIYKIISLGSNNEPWVLEMVN